MERSLKHRLSITICDIAHLIANMGNKIEPDFYSPNDGRLCEPTEENVENAKNDNLMVSVEFLKEAENKYIDEDPHTNPVTVSQCRVALFDRFHQNNCRKDIESLRKCSLVPERAGLINTQVVEQTLNGFKRDLYFINYYGPANQMFYSDFFAI